MPEETVLGSEIVKHPQIIDEIKTKYCLLCERGVMGGGRFDNLNKAINLMAEKGWRCVSITSGGRAVALYALMEKI